MSPVFKSQKPEWSHGGQEERTQLGFTSRSNTIFRWKISEAFVIKVVSLLGVK